MTELLHTILLRVTLAGVASAVALRVVGGGALREIVSRPGCSCCWRCFSRWRRCA